jgi:hypothetical protein
MLIKIGTLSAIYILNSEKERRPMHPHRENTPKAAETAIGTTIGATLSLSLIVVFSLSSLLAEQKDIQYHANEPHNQSVAIRAYLA